MVLILQNLRSKIIELNTKITTLTTNNNQLSQALAAANALVSELQGQLSNVDTPGSDPTPDDIAEVFAHVGIQDLMTPYDKLIRP